MRVLGIESSCDETGVAVYDTAQGLLAHTVYSQIELHQAYGGVVPELASRDHVLKLLPLLRETLAAAGLTIRELDGVAYTSGPGLAGALLVGAVLLLLYFGVVLISVLFKTSWVIETSVLRADTSRPPMHKLREMPSTDSPNPRPKPLQRSMNRS